MEVPRIRIAAAAITGYILAGRAAGRRSRNGCFEGKAYRDYQGWCSWPVDKEER